MSADSPNWSFILVAAGSGSRLGGMPKQFRTLGGLPVWLWSAKTADRLYKATLIDELIVVLPADYDFAQSDYKLTCPVKFVRGGATRTDSVLNGLNAAGGRYAMIHDAARPFIDEETCRKLIETTDDDRGAIPIAPSVDSLKRVTENAVSTLPRQEIFRTQTPQAFNREAIKNILVGSPDGATDEAALWIAAGRKLVTVEGLERNFKITTDFDWQIAQSLMNSTRQIRTGTGYDVHELVPGRRLVLGGREVNFDLGLLGHSDADIIAHAASDALLGAAGLPDIGMLFPASDMKYKDCDSIELLASVLDLLDAENWIPVWVDITLVAQLPRLGKITSEITAGIDTVLQRYNKSCRTNVKVKSGERVGSVGRGECMVCHAVATIERYIFDSL